MKYCPNCRLSYDDAAQACPQCGGQLMYYQPQPQPQIPAYDHTGEFDQRDISDNKVLAMLPYLMGWIGIVIVLLAASTSPYAAFHTKQALKIQVMQAIVTTLGILIPILGWICVAVYSVISLILNLIGFFSVCGGNAKEPPIVREFGFLK